MNCASKGGPCRQTTKRRGVPLSQDFSLIFDPQEIHGDFRNSDRNSDVVTFESAFEAVRVDLRGTKLERSEEKAGKSTALTMEPVCTRRRCKKLAIEAGFGPRFP